MMTLTDAQLAKLEKPGKYNLGDNLYLYVKEGGRRQWVFRYQIAGARREMGLGAFGSVTRKEARARAADAEKLLANGQDPILVKRARDMSSTRSRTFRQCAEEFIAKNKSAWKGPRQEPEWHASLENHVYHHIGGLPVSLIDRPLVVQVLEPIWNIKAETASRVRSRIERILDYATVKGYREGANPAAWGNNLEHILPAREEVAAVEHHPAMPVDDLPAFFARLAAHPGTPSRALEFVILTCVRTTEALGATWDEVDFKNELWVIPKERMKDKTRGQRVPLSPRALSILTQQRALARDHFVFPGRFVGRHLSNMAALMTLRRMGYAGDDATVHGFRSTFRDWVSSRTDHSREAAEKALHHAVGNKTEAAYFRDDLLDKRRPLMNNWAAFCASAMGPQGPRPPSADQSRSLG
jgi:integrase